MDEVHLHCLECGHIWSILCRVEIDGGVPTTKVGMFADLCPICEAQGEIVDEDPVRQAG